MADAAVRTAAVATLASLVGGCSGLDADQSTATRTLSVADFSGGTAPAVLAPRIFEDEGAEMVGPPDPDDGDNAIDGGDSPGELPPIAELKPPAATVAKPTPGTGSAATTPPPAKPGVASTPSKGPPTNPALAPPTSPPTPAKPASGASGASDASKPSPPGSDSSNAPATPERWVVDGLIGQINGRPIFADQFLEPIEPKLRELAAMSDRPRARAAMLALIHARFEDWVNSELIISEAESQLTPEQQQGFLAWLRSMQEQEIAERGATRAAALESLQEELGVSIEEFMQQRRDTALASLILNKRVTPRTIVSSRDLEQEYARRYAEFNPPPTVVIGRIRLQTSEAEKVKQVTDELASGKPFADVATAAGMPNKGQWIKFEQPPNTTLEEAIVANGDLNTGNKDRLKGLSPGQAAAPIVEGRYTVWLGIVSVESPPHRPLYDPDVQLQLKAELNGRRAAIERARYLMKLRSRWISDDISLIEDRIVQVAMARYWKT